MLIGAFDVCDVITAKPIASTAAFALAAWAPTRVLVQIALQCDLANSQPFDDRLQMFLRDL